MVKLWNEINKWLKVKTWKNSLTDPIQLRVCGAGEDRQVRVVPKLTNPIRIKF